MGFLKKGILWSFVLAFPAGEWTRAGIGKTIQGEYTGRYVNSTVFLRIPLRGARQQLMVRRGGITPDNRSVDTGVTFKVGEQIRITDMKFANHEIRFELSSLDLGRQNELVFRFPAELQDRFAQRGLFDTALEKTFTAGLTNAQIAEARRGYLSQEFRRVVGEMASTAGTSEEFVLRAVIDQIPGVQSTREEAGRIRKELDSTRIQLSKETKARKQAEGELTNLRRTSSDNDSVIDSLKRERETLVEERAGLRREVERLKGRSSDYKRRLDALAESLNVKSSSNADLTRSVSRLNQTIETLEADLSTARSNAEERDRLNKKLTRDLGSVRGERNRLKRNLRDLTSDRKSLSARYIDVKNQKDDLSTVVALTGALRVETRRESRDEAWFHVGAIFLNKHKIGTLEIQEPAEPEGEYLTRFSVDSPDTVEFNEQERALYSALGEKLTLEVEWTSAGDDVAIRLAEGEATRSVAPRESVQWRWNLTGTPRGPVRTNLAARFVGPADHRIPLLSQDFEIRPGGVLDRVQTTFSAVWMGAGALIGMLLMTPVLLMRRRPSRIPSPTKRAARETREGGPPSPYVSQKKF